MSFLFRFHFQKCPKREKRGEQERIAIEFCRAGVDAKAFARCKGDDFIGIAILNGCLGDKVFSVINVKSQLGL